MSLPVDINEITWWRTYLIVDMSPHSHYSPALSLNGGKLIHPFLLDSESDNPFRYKLNIAIAGGRSLLEEGFWSIVDADSESPLTVSDDVLLRIEDLTRSFFYKKEEKLYSIRFFVPEETSDVPSVNLDVAYYKKDASPRKDISLVKFAKRCLNLYYKLVSHFYPKKGNRVLFMSENNDVISGNLAAINTRMAERCLDSQFEVDYSFRNIFSERLKLTQWLSVVNKIARQDYIFIEDYSPIFAAIDLSPKTKLIQVWHAGFGFKAVGFGRFGIDESPNPFASCHRKYTYALVGNEYLREIYSEVFGIEPEALLATGMPRLDGFLDPEISQKEQEVLEEEIPEVKDSRVVLFAPTYRGKNQNEAHYDYSKIDFDSLYQFCQETKSIVLFKMHRFIREKILIPTKYKDCFFDVSEKNINDVFYATDILVTDYSSCFYDFLLLDKPILFYCYDRAYYSATRGVHRPIEELAPGKICDTFEELLLELKKTSVEDKVERKVDKRLIDCSPLRKIKASDAVIDTILLEKDVEGVCLR